MRKPHISPFEDLMTAGPCGQDLEYISIPGVALFLLQSKCHAQFRIIFPSAASRVCCLIASCPLCFGPSAGSAKVSMIQFYAALEPARISTGLLLQLVDPHLLNFHIGLTCTRISQNRIYCIYMNTHVYMSLFLALSLSLFLHLLGRL